VKNGDVVHRTKNGYAHYWFEKEEGGIIYRIIYNNGRAPLATNTMDIIKKQLEEKEDEPTTNQQLTLF